MSNVMKNLICRQWVFSRLILPFCVFFILGHTQAQPAPDKRRVNVEISTELGNIVVELYNETPIHRDNFVQLVKRGAYDSLLFHRVIPGFMIQGGDPNSRNALPGIALGDDTTKNSLPAEITPRLFHQRGALAAAREGDDVNPERRSSCSQFYIVQGRTYAAADLERIEERNQRNGIDRKFSEAEKQVYSTIGGAPHLDGAYTVYGRVLEGMDVVDAIAALPVDARDRPLQDVRMFMQVK